MKLLGLIFYALTGYATAADVALDVGHSRLSPGVISASGIPEWELNRLLALEVAANLDRIGVSYRMIGNDGNVEILTQRTALAQPDKLFISLHHDSVLPEWLSQADRYRGYSLFISRKNSTTDKSLACAQFIGHRLLAAGFQPSRYHATPIKGENRPFADQRHGIHYFDGLAVLRTARQPAVLIEAGVVVNAKDEAKVTSEEGRNQVAKAIALAVNDCLLKFRLD